MGAVLALPFLAHALPVELDLGPGGRLFADRVGLVRTPHDDLSEGLAHKVLTVLEALDNEAKRRKLTRTFGARFR